ncbi:MAG: 4-hydroxy-tetrahydrodipicolinate reductase [Bacteroidota bacterium]|nr:4-hydroxy-tetrahydrodipicolinate reductase [Bacteroidota bacterium]
MRILLVGYGKMGQTIEGIAIKRGHTIAGKIDVNNASDIHNFNNSNTDAAIEFTHPNSAFNNVSVLLNSNIPTVCGTTGWLDKKQDIENLCKSKNGSFIYASNYSIGVNIFWAVNEYMAILMNKALEYDVTMDEIHHVYKKDAPSGTAITAAEGVLKHLKRKNKWTIDRGSISPSDLYIDHHRIHNKPGTHTVMYTSPVDSIELTHTAFNRDGFATGSVVAAEYIHDKKGIFSMKEVLGINV